MLGKLIKDELKSYRFPFGIIFLTGVIFTIFMKIICMLPYQQGAKEIIQIFGAYGYYFIIMLMGVAAQVLVIIRFYSTMVGDRGYLTWTLPASSSTHIWAKLIGGMLWRILTSIVVIVLLVIFFVGDYWAWLEGFTVESSVDSATFGEFIEAVLKVFKPEYLIPVILGLFAAIVWSVFSQLLLYMCISIGQLFGKWRIPASIGCYFVIMICMEIISVIGTVMLSMSSLFTPDINFELSGVMIFSVILAVIFLIGLGLDAIMFAVTNHIFKKHLNLE